jgi:hypothetical protein
MRRHVRNWRKHCNLRRRWSETCLEETDCAVLGSDLYDRGYREVGLDFLKSNPTPIIAGSRVGARPAGGGVHGEP